MQPRSAEYWQMVLTSVGVERVIAASWAPSFSSTFVGDVFSSGDRELVPFCANVLHESTMLKKLAENLNYTTTARLTEVWPSRFPNDAAGLPFINNPQKLAARVYGGRLGNKTDKDAWDFRGSGLIMVTGKTNFEYVQKVTGLPVVANPDLLRRADPASLKFAIQWWEGKVPDSVIGDTVRTRKAVNGGDIGLKHVQQLTQALTPLLR